MEGPSELIGRYGLWIVFMNVLVEQLGIPMPAVPTMIIAAAHSAEHQPYSLTALFLSALAGSFVSDLAWFRAGRRFSNETLTTVCGVAGIPESCVSKVGQCHAGWGIGSLIAARFIPGVGMLASASAGALGVSLQKFAFYNFIATSLWISTALALGAVFHDQIGAMLGFVQTAGLGSIAAFAVVISLVAAHKWLARYRLYQRARSDRDAVDEPARRFNDYVPAVFIDVRSDTARNSDTHRIPGSLVNESFGDALKQSGKHTDIAVYCSGRQENASHEKNAAHAAQLSA